MTQTRRSILKAASAIPLAAAVLPSLGQQYPSRPIKIIVPAGPGTGIDAVTRFVADALSKRVGQPVIADNRAGAGGLLGYTFAAKAAPDGYTLILTGIPLYLLPLFSEAQQPPFDPVKDFAPVARVARVPQAVVVAPDSPYTTLKELVDAMRSRPDAVTYSSQGVGSSAHLCGAVLTSLSRTKAQHIPYKESSSALTDVVGGRITFTCLSSAQVLPLIQGGKLRVLGVTNSRRWEALPQVPTVAEGGVPGFDVSSQLDMLAPAGTPEPIRQLLSDEIVSIVKSASFAEFCLKQVIVAEPMTYKALVPEIAREVARWKQIAQTARG